MNQPFNPLMNALNNANVPQPPVMPTITPNDEPQYQTPAPQVVAPVLNFANATVPEPVQTVTPTPGAVVPEALFNSTVGANTIPFVPNAPVAPPMPMPSTNIAPSVQPPSIIAPTVQAPTAPAPVVATPVVEAQPIMYTAPVVEVQPVIQQPVAPVVVMEVQQPVVQAPVQQAAPLFQANVVVEQEKPQAPKRTRSKPAAQQPQSRSTELVRQDNERGVLEYSPRFSMDQMLTAAKVMIDSGLCPKNINAPEQVVMIMKMGSEIGLNTMAALNNIHSIQGRPTLGVHAITGQLKKFGVTYNVVKDFSPVMDNLGNAVDYETVIEFVDLVALDKFKKELLEIRELPDDIRRLYVGAMDRTKDTIYHRQSFSWGDAMKMGLTGKDNWQKMPKQMCNTRCLTLGGRFFKPEAMMGYLETSEAAEVYNVEHSIDEEGEVTILS